MVRTKQNMDTAIRENLRGGRGALRCLTVFAPEETFSKCNLCSKISFLPGESIGPHPHDPDAELYYILDGELTVTEDGREYVVHAGDGVFTGGGSVHEVANRSEKPASMLAVVIR